MATRFIKDWEEDVIRNVPAENLLLYNVKEGWEPLARFLGVACPDTEFPRLNEAATIQKVTSDIMMIDKILKSGVSLLLMVIGGWIYQYMWTN